MLKRIKAVKVALSHLRSETATRGAAAAAAAVTLNLYICAPHKKSFVAPFKWLLLNQANRQPG